MKLENETYLHRKAIEVMIEWIYLNPDIFDITTPFRVATEESFSLGGNVWFNCDIVIYDESGIRVIIEIFNKNEVDSFKLFKMQYYFYNSNISPKVYEIKASHILNQMKVNMDIYKIQLN